MKETGFAAAPAHSQSCPAPRFVEVTARDIETSLVSRIAQQVATHRDCLAVRDPDLSLTYGELDAWSNGIAGHILDRGAAGRPVAILLPQGAASVASILGALKSGSPYVSLDPSDPRSPELLERVDAGVLVADAGFESRGRPVVVAAEAANGPRPGVTPATDDTAYVFFTSGSTGGPKGVFDSHRNVLHNVLRYTNTLRIAPTDRLSLIQSPAFSGTASSVFSALTNGASVFPFPLAERGIGALARWLLEQSITVYHSVPAIFRALVEVEPGPYERVRVVRLEGDRAAWTDVELHRRHFPSSVLVNGLGLTETGLVRQLFVHEGVPSEHGALPVGYPVPGVGVAIVDDDVREVPQGLPGEIVVQSGNLACGYWNDPDLTAARFRTIGGKRAYLTGDLGRLRDDGCLEYLGRKDGLLKVLGNRVEPAEVEAEILRLPGVRDAAVLTGKGRREQGRLVAYVVAEPGCAPDAHVIRARLRERLPSFMVPSAVVFLDELPVGAGGKVDRSMLPSGEAVPASSPTPVAHLERCLLRIWEDVLEIAPIGLDDDFFELGGDSLASAEIVARLGRETEAAVPLSAIAGAPTVRALAEMIRGSTLVLDPSPVVLRSGSGAPLVVLHGNVGHALQFAELAAAVEHRQPVWALEHGTPVAGSIREMAARHLDSLLGANPDGPHLLAGLCYGAVVAHELACQLVTAGHRVGLVAMLGITPLEFPTVASREAVAAWDAMHGHAPVGARMRRHAGHARRLGIGAGARYLTALSLSVGRRGRGAFAAPARTRRAFRHALARHHPSVYPGRVLVVLHGDETPEYTADPEREWASLAGEVEVVTLPGRGHAMIEQPGVRQLVELLHAKAESGAPG